MNFIDLVKRAEQIIRANDLEVDRDFRVSYFLRSGLCDTAKPIAKRGVELLLKVASDGINDKFSGRRSSIIKQLSDEIVSLTKLDDSKVGKIRHIEAKIDRLAGEADGLSTGDAILNLRELVSYCEQTKEGLEVLLNAQLGDHKHFQSADVRVRAEKLLTKLDEVLKVLESGELHDRSSKTAGEYYNRVYKVLNTVRTRALDGYITTATLTMLDGVLETLAQWKQLSGAPGKKERIGTKERQNYVHQRNVSDDSIDTICGFSAVSEEFSIFVSDLEAQEKRVEEGKREIKEKQEKIAEFQRKIGELERAKEQAGYEFQNDGNVAKFNSDVKNCNEQIKDLQHEIAVLNGPVSKRSGLVAIEEKLAHDVRETLYNGVLELSRTPYLFCDIARRISWPVISGVLSGRLGEGELQQFQVALAEVAAGKKAYEAKMSAAVVEADRVEGVIREIEEMQPSEESKKAREIIERETEAANTTNSTELSDEAQQVLAAIGAKKTETPEKGDENKTETVLPGLSKNDR